MPPLLVCSRRRGAALGAVLAVLALSGAARAVEPDPDAPARSAVLEVMGEDYVRTARAKGLDEKAVVRKHVMANSLLPIITLFGLSMPFLVSGAVITEQVFSWPGIGRAAIDAIASRDVFVVTAVTLAATVIVVAPQATADTVEALLDDLGVDNVVVAASDDPASGHPTQAPFDVIVVVGSVAEVPPALLEQIGEGGRVVAVVSHGRIGKAMVFTRLHGVIGRRDVCDAQTPLCPGFSSSPGFAF